MIQFEKEELQEMLFVLQEWRSPVSDWQIYTRLKGKVEEMIKIMSSPKHQCKCSINELKEV